MHVVRHLHRHARAHRAHVARAAHAVLVRERLEVHRLGGVHLLAEAQQVEGRVRADLVLHAFLGFR